MPISAPLSPHDRLGPYEILGPIGTGGMGEVYRALDSRLAREVAIKILPASMAHDPERRARFEAEAHAASALNHPGIVTVYDIGSQDDHLYLVTEFIDGATLSQSRPDSLRKQLDVASQVAEALAAAHAAGITHRDLKPGNIMVTRDDRAKVLDFGLARHDSAFEKARGADAATLTMGPETTPGMIMGTAGYMSPEQARAQRADARSDIFSLGVVMYEMFSGKRAFEASTFADALIAIVSTQPPELPPSIPDGVRQVVARCMEKDPARRFQSAQDLAFALRALAGSSFSKPTEPVEQAAKPQPGLSRAWPLALTGALILVFALAFARLATEPQSPDASHYRFRPFATENYDEHSPVWSPDGKSIAYVARPKTDYELTVKATDGSAPVVLVSSPRALFSISWTADASRLYYIESLPGEAPLRGTILSISRAGGQSTPVAGDAIAYAAALSPDGRTLASLIFDFVKGESRKVLKLSSPPESSGKALRTYVGGFTPNDIAWSPDGTKILLSLTPPEIRLVDVRTGQDSLLATPPVSVSATPGWLPDSRHAIISWPKPASLDPGYQDLWLLNTANGDRQPVLENAEGMTEPAVSPDGASIAYVSDPQDYDLVELPLDGSPPRPLLATRQPELWVNWSPTAPEFAYVSGNQIRIRRRDESLDRAVVTADQFPAGTLLMAPAFSPDGSRIAFMTKLGPNMRAWLASVGGGAPAPLMESPQAGMILAPSWSPDGRWLAFNFWNRQVARILVGGNGKPEVLSQRNSNFPVSWSPDGKRILASEAGRLYTMLADGGPPELLATEYEALAVWSREERYIYVIRDSAKDTLLDGVPHIDGTRRRQLGRLDWRSGVFQPIVEIPANWSFGTGFSSSVGLSLAPDGKSVATTLAKATGDIWILDGFEPPPSLWQRLWRK